MGSILYLSYTGLLDPLGEGQILQYLKHLSRKHAITLMTFEKRARLRDKNALAKMETICREAGINWHRRIWHSRPSLPMTIWDVVMGCRQAVRLAQRENAQLVHSRGYIGSLMALCVKRATGLPFIFDMRGFWADERLESGRWSKSGLPYRLSKKVEKALLLNADYLVSLTRAGIREIATFDYLEGRVPPHSVIPTCTNLDLFRLRPKFETPFTLGYNGSIGSWYLFNRIAQVVARLMQIDSEALFLVINKDQHDLARAILRNAHVDLSRVEIRQASFAEVGEQLSRTDAGIFFYKPLWSKSATSPTRLGEFLACGKPCLSNTGIGDVAENLSETNTGVLIPATSDGDVDLASIDDSLRSLRDLAAKPDIAMRCRSVAKQRFALERGVAQYDEIYHRMIATADGSIYPPTTGNNTNLGEVVCSDEEGQNAP